MIKRIKDIVGNKENKHSSLARELVVWILVLSLLPLIIVSWVNYKQASNGLEKAAEEKLEQSSNLTVSFIKNWFEYRLMDLNIQAESTENVKLLSSLVSGFKKSGKNISDYVKSYDWAKRVDGSQNNLITLTRRYDYIYDIFLIDIDGNIVFSVANESDLGTNLKTGPYSGTLFATSVNKTLKTGLVNFSDIERYAPSSGILAGFLTSPLLDEFGGKVGVFAIQLKLNRILDVTYNNLSRKTSLTHYLVGIDGMLRSSRNLTYSGRDAYSDSEILTRKINTKQFHLWKKERDEKKYLRLITEEIKDKDNYIVENKKIEKHYEAYKYMGPNKSYVVGLHNSIYLPGGVEWILISEINEDEALAAVSGVGKVTFILLVMTSLFVVVLTFYQARRISKPIVSMLDTSLKVASGKLNEHVVVSAKNEIGQLADAFNLMLDNRRRYEKELEKTTVQTEAALLEVTEQKYAMDQHSIVAITNIKGTITFANKKFSEISGYDIDELVGQNHRLLNSGYHDADFFQDMYRTIAKGNVWHNEVCNKAKDGRLYWVDTTVVPFMGENGKPKSYIAIRTDITKNKKVESDLLSAKDTAESATKQKSEFLANMSHEIRTPMNGVIGMTGLLLDTELDSKQRSYAESTMSSAESLLAIINDILDFSKIEAGKMELELLPFNLESIMEDVSELMAIKCREKSIEMLLHFKQGTEKSLIGDTGRIRQILLNLLSNAIKFTEKGSVLLSISSVVNNGVATVSVSVSDSGIGIDDDKLGKIFNKFDQEDGSTTRKYGGTGLGLAICRQLCQLMGGDIKVESQKGHGSIFSFTMSLPLTNEAPVSSISLSNSGEFDGKKLLIVDDLDIARTILSEQVSSLNLDIETASSGEIALEKLKVAIKEENPFDIVITDFHMPKMDGEMLAAKIKEFKLLEQGVLIFITSSPRKGDGLRLEKLGFDGYLTKPTRAFEVSQIISLILNAKNKGKDIPLVTRHLVQEVRSGNKQKVKLKNTHILLAEDNPVNQMVATEYLEKYGCTVSPAGNGLEAVTEFKNSIFDLVFMDCQMPEMDGYEATSAIRQWEELKKLNKTPIIAFTANAMQGDKEICLASGMDDYISKPIQERALEELLKKWLPDKIIMTSLENNEVVEMRDETLDEKNSNVEPNTDEGSQLNLSVFNVLKEMFGDAFSAAVESHSNSAKNNIQQIEDALNNNDAEKLEHAAHSLKGASGQFGAVVLSELAKQMEMFGKSAEINKAKEIIDELKLEREEVENIMKKEMG